MCVERLAAESARAPSGLGGADVAWITVGTAAVGGVRALLLHG